MKKGFTLIELLVVVLIIGILSAVALPQYTQAVEKARAAEALSMLGSVRYAVERYRLQTGNWPGNSFDVLDIEVPTSQNFTYAMDTTTSTSNVKYISAHALKPATADRYYLVVGIKADGTTLRSCGSGVPAASATLTKATAPTGNMLKLCNAISSGKPDGF